MLWLGCAAFALFFLGDWNDLWLHKKPLALCFPAGLALLTAACVLGLRPGAAPVTASWGRLLLAAAGLVFLLLLVWTLFFAIPAGRSYAAPGRARPVCRRGVYALCRHPGVLWLAGLQLCLWLGGGLPLPFVLACTALNTALVAFEDRRVFPRLLSGYDAYRRETPFLLPTPASLRAALRRER